MRRIGVGTFETSPKMREYVNQVLDSGRLSYGPFSEKLESCLAELHGCSYGVLSNSGTSSLQVALQALKEIYNWQDGDEVICPALTFVATINVVLHNRLKPVLADVDSLYYGLDPTLLEAAITPRTRAIIPVHPFGQPCDIKNIMQIASRHNLLVIEDSCECMLATQDGISVGAWGDIACYSTYIAHLLTTGVGGLGITNNPDYAGVMRSLINHGRNGIYYSIDHSQGLDSEALKQVVSRRFEFERIGHSFRVTELEAAIGLAQLDDLASCIAWRNLNAKYLSDNLAPFGDLLQLPQTRPGCTHSFMMYPVVVKNGSKWPLVNWLEVGSVDTREMLPLTSQPCYAGLFDPALYPVAEQINESGFYLPIHQHLSQDDLVYMVDRVAGFFDGR